MNQKEYIKTIAYNGHMVNIGLENDSSNYFFEFLDEKGKLTQLWCTAVNSDYQKDIEYYFGEPTMCVSYKKHEEENTPCNYYNAHGYCVKCPFHALKCSVDQIKFESGK